MYLIFFLRNLDVIEEMDTTSLSGGKESRENEEKR
jgi:hypothetical protein